MSLYYSFWDSDDFQRNESTRVDTHAVLEVDKQPRIAYKATTSVQDEIEWVIFFMNFSFPNFHSLQV